MKSKVYRKNDLKRVVSITLDLQESYRSDFRRDLSRLVHSPAFRRLQGKTQLFPGRESDFFRNRLTHSMEVAQIGKSIALKINNDHHLQADSGINLDLIEFACLAHDIGHPPFGHQGEQILDELMKNAGGFEGNAQTLRILTKLEKKDLPADVKNTHDKLIVDETDNRLGLNLTCRSIASIIKYDRTIPKDEGDREKGVGSSDANKYLEKRPVKGYYYIDSSTVDFVKSKVLRKGQAELSTIECQIMDIADDIAYSTYDLEDSLKAGFVTPLDIIYPKPLVLENVVRKVRAATSDSSVDEKIVKDVLIGLFSEYIQPPKFEAQFDGDLASDQLLEKFPAFFHSSLGFIYPMLKRLGSNGYERIAFTSKLIKELLLGVQVNTHDEKDPNYWSIELSREIKLKVEIVKNLNYELQILSTRLRIAEVRGKEIIRKIWETLNNPNEKNWQLLPPDFRDNYLSTTGTLKQRVICDFIGGMTDRYCIEFYGRLTSENPETIFKPI